MPPLSHTPQAPHLPETSPAGAPGELKGKALQAAAARVLQAHEGLCVVGYDHKGRVAGWSEAARSLWGYSVGETADLAFASLHDDAIADDLFPPDDGRPAQLRDGVSHRLSGTTASGSPVQVEAAFASAAPKDAPVAWWCLYRRLEGSATQHDASDRLRELLLSMIECLHDGLCLLEIDSNRITFVNSAFLEITGFTRLDLQGNTFECLLAEWPLWRSYLLPQLELLKRKGRSAGSSHWNVELPSGGRTLEVYGMPIFKPEVRPNFLLLVVNDITEKQHLSNQLVQSEKLAAIGQLAAGIAHEIRSPLAAIQHALYDLKQIVGADNKDAREDIGIAWEEIERVQDIIKNLLDFARESDHDHGPVRVDEVVEQTLRILRKNLSNKSITAKTRFAEAPVALIGANPLKQILINLLTNAAHAMSEGGELTITVDRQPGPVSAPAPGQRQDTHVPSMAYGDDARERRRRRMAESIREHIVLRVADTGCGIAPEFLPQVFNPFFTTKPPGSGTGLGLSVVHAQVRDHGGVIYVTSTVGKGTTFTIKLPAVAGDTEA